MDKFSLVLKSLLENLQKEDNSQQQQQQQHARDEDERLKQLVREVIAEKSQSSAQNDLLHRVVGLMEQQVASSNREKYQQDVASVTQTFQSLMRQTEAGKKPSGAENMVVSDKQEMLKDLLDKKSSHAGGDVHNKNVKLNVTKNRFPRGPFDEEEDLKKPQPKEGKSYGEQKVMNNGTTTKPERGKSAGRGGKRGAAGPSVPPPPLLPVPYPAPHYQDHYPGQAAPGLHQDNRGRGNYQDNRGRGNYQDNRGRGNYQDNRGRGNYQDNRGRGNYQDNRGRGNYQDNRGRGNYQDSRGRGNYQNQGPGNQFLGDNYQGRENYENQVPGNYPYHGPGNYQNQGSENYPHQGPGNYPHQGPGNYPHQGPGNYPHQGPGNYPHQGPGNYPHQGPGNYPHQGPGNYPNQGAGYDVNQGAVNFPSQDPQDFQDHGSTRQQIQGRGTFRHRGRGNYPGEGNDAQHHQLPETSSARDARSRPRGRAHTLRARSYSEHRDPHAAQQPPLQAFHEAGSAAPYEGQGAYPKHAQNSAEGKKYKAKKKTKPSQQQNVEPGAEEESDDEERVSKPEFSSVSNVDRGTHKKNANIFDNDVDSDASTASAFLPGVIVKKRNNNNNKKKKKQLNKASSATDLLADGTGLSGDGESAPMPDCGPGQGGTDAPLQLFLGSGFNEEVAKTMDDLTEIADFMLIAKVKGVIKTCTPKTLGELRAFKEEHPLAEVIVVRSKDE